MPVTCARYQGARLCARDSVHSGKGYRKGTLVLPNRSPAVDWFLLTLSVSGGTITPSLPWGRGAALVLSMRLPKPMGNSFQKLARLLADEQGQDIAEYAVMLAVILVLVVGTIRLVGSNANNAFSSVASSLQ